MSVSSEHSDQNPSRLLGITGIILAGGKSNRYGKNKALVHFNGVPLIEKGISVLQSLFENLILVTNTPDEYAYLGLPMFRDLIKGLGPLGGIYTGLEAIEDGWGFVTACDMPFLNHDLVRRIVSLKDEFDAVVPRVDWKIEALHALYSKSCLPAIREMINTDEYQIIRLFQKIRIKYLNEEEIRAVDPDLRSFTNINRPQELSNALNSDE